MENNKHQKNKGGRNPKKDPALFRYTISLSSEEHLRFLRLFEESGMRVKAHFITACIFQRTVRVVKIDKAKIDYYVKLTQLYEQFRAIGVNYNQVVKLLHAGFTEKKARFYLYKLEKETIQLAAIGGKILEMTQGFEEGFLKS